MESISFGLWDPSVLEMLCNAKQPVPSTTRLNKMLKYPHYIPPPTAQEQEVVEAIPCRHSPPPCSTATMMDGNHDVSLLLAWNSCWRSVKKTPMQQGKPSVSPCSTTAASRTIHAHPWSWGLAVPCPAASPWDMIAPFSSKSVCWGREGSYHATLSPVNRPSGKS